MIEVFDQTLIFTIKHPKECTAMEKKLTDEEIQELIKDKWISVDLIRKHPEVQAALEKQSQERQRLVDESLKRRRRGKRK